MNDLSLDPSRTALLLMDLQPSILASHPDADAFLAELGCAREAARAAGATIGYVRVALSEEDAAHVPAHSRFAAAAERVSEIGPDHPAVSVDPRIAPADGEIVVRKSRYGAFSTTDLHEQLRARGIDTLVLAGISTSGVVLSTARDGVDKDYRIVVLSDGTFDRDPEVHRVLTEKVYPAQQAAVVTIDELIGALAAV
ncbi:cysteine hydrolase family protein [Leifsonia sp. ZF2019]|uniref:cysteine hydrolase family protein n=1 Tax=Leifsonia sp. ZF2019 TaxID=2781978 RepID=UPI001CC17EA2|nr:isochorismatase family cysteine hydrolase [Leifsonia sp. ZF2019]